MKTKANNPKNRSLAKAIFIKEFKQSIDEINLAKQGKIKLKTADQLLDEL